jgi:hypothetical protein
VVRTRQQQPLWDGDDLRAASWLLAQFPAPL